VELSAGLKWAVITLICPCWGSAARFATNPQDQAISSSWNTYTIHCRVGQRQQNFENRTDINSTKILKQLLSLLNNILDGANF
jgi:hypothetical protein